MMPFPDPPAAIRSALERRAVASSFCHVWSDALFARARAREEGRLIQALECSLATESYAMRDPRTAAVRERRRSGLRAKIHQHRWDRGVYARNCVIAAWQAFERVAATLLGVEPRGDLLAELDGGLARRRVAPLDRSQPIWRGLVATKERRDAFLYGDCDGEQLLIDEHDADEAIAIVRAALQTLYDQLEQRAPAWVDSDGAPDHTGGDAAWGTTVRGDARNDPWAISIIVVHREFEWTSDLLPHDVDPWPVVLERLDSVCEPITAVRVCQGAEVLEVVAWTRPLSSVYPAAQPGSAA